jgi:ABC-2 type transport system ATP-binding protein
MDGLQVNAGSAAIPVLRVANLTAGYDGRPVISGINIEVALGEWVALLGPNGSGKSTLLYCIAQMLHPTSGDIQIGGHSLALDPANAKRLLGFGCAPERLPGLLTGRQCLEVYAAAKGVREVDNAVLSLAKDFALETLLDQFVDTYSLGTRQKLAVLLALIGTPRLILLDEAFNGLDAASGRRLKGHLKKLVEAGSASVLLATHDLDVVERYAQRAALLLSGNIIQIWGAGELARIRAAEGGLEEAISRASESHLA